MFGIGGLFYGYVFVYNLGFLPVSAQSLIEGILPGLAAPILDIVLPVAQDSGTAGPAWTGKDRVNILLLGLDERDAQSGFPSRSDTIIVLTVDPTSKTAAMLSIPRDLWVPIPGVGENKINTAHFFGEQAKKGDGPLLTKRTIEYNFGIPIHYYARVNFRGFEKLIDLIGGVDLNAPRPILDDEFPIEENEGIKRVLVQAGWQHLDGQAALEYARSRHSENDFGRSRRQQAVIVAAKERALQPDILPKIPALIGILRENLTTDIPSSSLLALFNLSRSIGTDNIRSAAIDGSLMNDIYGDGTIFTPRRAEIASLIAELFGQPDETGTPQLVATARVTVLNGTSQPGIATKFASYLKDKGYVVVRVDDAQSSYAKTTILDQGTKSSAVTSIAKMLNVSTNNVIKDTNTTDDAEITVVLGADFKLPSN